jgi:hypothetical protein
MKRLALILAFLGALAAGGRAGAHAADSREIPLDVYVIVDTSSAMEAGREQAVAWLCGQVIDGIARDGDTLSLWTAGERPELLYSGAVSADSKEEAKKLVKSIAFSGSRADYRGALSAARDKAAQGKPGRLAYTLLISGASPKDPPIREAESAGLLLYSRVDSFPGWRVFTVGLDLSDRVRDSAAAYMKNR